MTGHVQRLQHRVRDEWHLNLSKSFMRNAFCMLRGAVA